MSLHEDGRWAPWEIGLVSATASPFFLLAVPIKTAGDLVVMAGLWVCFTVLAAVYFGRPGDR